MGVCPADFKPCIDDVCYGSGCLRLRGSVPVLVPCNGCGQLVGIDGTDPCDACQCDDDWWDDQDEDDWRAVAEE